MDVTRSLQFQESLSSLAPESNNFIEEQKTYDACVKVSVIRRFMVLDLPKSNFKSSTKKILKALTEG